MASGQPYSYGHNPDPPSSGASNGESTSFQFRVPVVNLGPRGERGKPNYEKHVIKTDGSRESSSEPSAGFSSNTLPAGLSGGQSRDQPRPPFSYASAADFADGRRSLPRNLEKGSDSMDKARSVQIEGGSSTDGSRVVKIKTINKKGGIAPEATVKGPNVFNKREHKEEEESRGTTLNKEWVQVQKKTFTNWFRDRVKDTASKPLEDIQVDLKDGRLLHDLMRALTEGAQGTRVAGVSPLSLLLLLRPHQKPVLRVQQIENVNLAIMSMKEERVPIVGIGGEDICDGNLKLILGMIWCLIIRYQIADISITERKISAKNVLLQWMQAQVPSRGVTNFTKNWNNGITLAALIDSLRPGLIPDWQSWSPDNAVANVQTAMQIAYEQFDIPQIIEPNDMAALIPDELSMMTYLSYFCGPDSIGFHTLKNWVNARIPDPLITNFSSDWKDGRALCSLVDSFIPGYMPSSEEVLRSPPMQNVTKAMGFSKDRLTVEANLSPQDFCNPDIDPLSVMTYISRFRSAKPKQDAASQVGVVGTGISGGSVGQEASFFVRNVPPGSKVVVTVTAPDGSDVPVVHRTTDTGSLHVFYTPPMPGTYTVEVQLDGKHIYGSPFKVIHHDAPQPNNCIVSGSGLQRAQVGQWAEFQVDCVKAGPGNLQVTVRSPQGEIEPEVDNKSDHVFGVRFEPLSVGQHQINMTWAGLPIPGGPHLCQVSDPSKCIASGPGLSGGKLNKPMAFNVSTIGAGPGHLEASVFGPEGTVSLERRDSPEDTGFTYTPCKAGSYLIDVKWDGFPIAGSPFKVRPAAAVDASRVIVMKPPSSVKASVPTSFLVNTKSAGHGVLKAEARGPHVSEKCQIYQEEEGMYRVTFNPIEVGRYDIDVTYGGGRVPLAPFTVAVKDPTGCVVDAKAVAGQTIRANETVVIPVSTKMAGDGDITATARGPGGLQDLPVTKQVAGFYNVTFTPDTPGLHLLDIYFDGDAVTDSSIQIKVDPPGDITFEKPPTHDGYYYTGEQLDFVAHTPDDDLTELKVSAFGIRSNAVPSISVERQPGAGQVVHLTATQPDDYRVDVNYGGQPISGSPFVIPVVTPPNARAVVLGDPVIPLQPGRPIEMSVDATHAGTGGLAYNVTGKLAGQVRADSTMIAANVYNIYFVPPIDDDYAIDIFWARDQVPGSPVIISYSQQEDDPPVQITVDPEQDGIGSLTATAVCRTTGESTPVEVRQYERGKYRLAFDPPCPDLYHLKVLWNGDALDGSPFEIDCRSVDGSSVGGDADHLISKLRAEVLGENAGNIATEVVQLDNGDYQVRFMGRTRELYQTSLFWQNRKIKGSPFEIDKRPK
uniref:Filamin-like 7 n=1 Tax=Halisarca dujardinii TaxID=2583056 RepID=A0A9F1U438_HALDU|nr:filamin-like 7 [Halisarca dujardinii]